MNEIAGFDVNGHRVEFSPPTRSGSVPSAIAQALVGFAPPSSSVFDSLRSAREIRATGNHRVAQNDEPELPTFAAIDASATAEARDAAAELEAFYERADRAREAAKASRTTVNDQRAERLQFDAQARADWVAR